jgi:hypothetical protein
MQNPKITILYTFLFFPICATSPAHLIPIELSSLYLAKSYKAPHYAAHFNPCNLIPLRSTHSPQHPVLKHSKVYVKKTKTKTKLNGLGPRANLSAKWLPTFDDRGCHVVSVTDPYDRILGFLDRSRYLSSSSSVVITRLSGPRSRPTTFFILVVPGIEPGPLDL